MIENIIFDFGGVLLNLDYRKSYDALSAVMELPLDMENLPQDVEKCLLDFEKGNINEETFLWKIQNYSKGTPQPRAIIDAWNAMLLGWNPDRFDMLLRLKESYNTYILSNTNSMHIQWVHSDLKRTHDIVDFEDRFFKKVYYSHEIRMRKPDLEIYDYVLNDAQLDPAKTLFIDDNKDNVEAAKSIGIQAVLHDPTEEIISSIDGYLAQCDKI